MPISYTAKQSVTTKAAESVSAFALSTPAILAGVPPVTCFATTACVPADLPMIADSTPDATAFPATVPDTAAAEELVEVLVRAFLQFLR